MIDTERYAEVLHKVWGYDSFRGIQLDIIQSIGSGRDTLGLMPTGGGKSITFQVPALCMEGTCLVVTPLIALMKDQVRELKARGIRATAIHSNMSHDLSLAALDNCILGGYKFLYLSPERLKNQVFLKKIQHLKLSFITIDEAHCISQWGYDFRPSYLEIAKFREENPDVPVLALTATATPEVVIDIQRQLNFKEENVFRMSYRRENLSYWVEKVNDSYQRLKELLRLQEGSVIIYMRNRQKCQMLAEQLCKDDIKATFYHAGLRGWEKDERQESWLKDETRVMVATNAFGMGINKPDVRMVFHITLPDSIEEYFQEAGRAGRDGQPARSYILLEGHELSSLQRRPAHAFPPIATVQDIYEKLCWFHQIAVGDGYMVTRNLDAERFCRAYHVFPTTLNSVLSLLQNAGYIELSTPDGGTSLLRILATRNALLSHCGREEERMLTSMFRNYGGLFVDYMRIDEALIATETELTQDYIYKTLSDMNRRGLVHYIPAKHTPTLTYLHRRVEKEDIVLPAHVYAERLKVFQRRIDAMYQYCARVDECRSRMLLAYFGETKSEDCGICDVCSEGSTPVNDEEAIRQHILQQLQNGPLAPSELMTAPFDADLFWNVLNIMYRNEEVWLKDFKIGKK